jgi:DNA-binding NarL/FixJ family response regulator
MDPILQSAALEAVYAAASGEGSWEAAAPTLAAAVGAQTMALILGDPSQGRFDVAVGAGVSEEARTLYLSHWHKFDPWQSLYRAGLENHVAHGTEAIRDTELRRSAFYQDFGRFHGLFHMIGTVAPARPGSTVTLGLHRPERAGSFTEAERQSAEYILKHLRRAAQLYWRLRETPQSLIGLDALEALSQGAIIADSNGRVVFVNTAALALAAPGGALSLRRVLTGEVCLFAVHPSDHEALRRAIMAAVNGGTGGALLLRPASGKAPVATLVAKIPTRFTEEITVFPSRALILLRPLNQSTIAPRKLMSIFGMTASEADVIVELADGTTAEEVASRRNVGVATVRTQAKSAMAKAEVANLRELARLLGLLTGTG